MLEKLDVAGRAGHTFFIGLLHNQTWQESTAPLCNGNKCPLSRTNIASTERAFVCIWWHRLPSVCLTGCSVVCTSGWFQRCLATLWQKEWREGSNLSFAVLLSFSVALQEYILQRSSLVLLVGQIQIIWWYDIMINEFKLTFWVFAVTFQGQIEALCSYLALPSNVFQLFLEHRDPVTPLLQR